MCGEKWLVTIAHNNWINYLNNKLYNYSYMVSQMCMIVQSFNFCKFWKIIQKSHSVRYIIENSS